MEHGGRDLRRDRQARRREPVDMRLVPTWNPVSVERESRGRLPVTELRGHVGDRRTLGQEVRRECMPEVIEPETRERSDREEPAEPLGDLLHAQWWRSSEDQGRHSGPRRAEGSGRRCGPPRS